MQLPNVGSLIMCTKNREVDREQWKRQRDDSICLNNGSRLSPI